MEVTTGKKVERVTGGAGYAHGVNYEALEARGTEAVIPPPKESRGAGTSLSGVSSMMGNIRGCVVRGGRC